MANRLLFLELDRHLLQDNKPSQFLESLTDCPDMKEHPFSMLLKLRQTEQNPVYHPEGSVWNHTLLVVDRAAEIRGSSREPRAFMWAALLHDIGKPDTTRLRKGKLTSYDHDRIGAKLSSDFLSAFTEDREFIERVSNLVRWHMQILFALKDSRFQNTAEMTRMTDIKEIALLGLCDRLGRLNADEKQERENVRKFIRKCSAGLDVNIDMEGI